MRVYNTKTRTKEAFIPREAGKVALYVCGPTVYNHIHVGNARTFLSFDVIRRYLLFRGYEVTFVQNITDVDDKIIKRANEEGRSAAEVAAEYTRAFIDAMHAMGVMDPTYRPYATEEVPTMVALVEQLIACGHAYVAEGDVYFSVRSFKDYGKLSGRDVDDMRSGARIEIDPRKRDPLDFALWKAAKPGEPFWDSPWGKGRPGWHIECSAMSQKYLGLPLDIHGGGTDLVFPHHENEVAQSEACCGPTFANYWLHGGMLLIDKEKMSKSVGNFLLLKDVLQTVKPAVLRLLMLQTHYRNPLDYSVERLDEAQASFDRLTTTVRNLHWAAEHAIDVQGDEALAADEIAATTLRTLVSATREQFVKAMDDDFNTAGALGAIFSLVSGANALMADDTLGAEGRLAARAAAVTIVELLGVFGLSVEGERSLDWSVEVVDLAKSLTDYAGKDAQEAIDALLATRQRARDNRDWARADGVRDGLDVLGFTIEDTISGARVLRKE